MRLCIALLVVVLIPACWSGGNNVASPPASGGGAALPEILTFTSQPSSLPAGGGSVTLSWTASGADQIVLSPVGGPVTGSQLQTTVTSTTIFSLPATNAAGTTTKNVVVTVAPSANNPVILSFTSTPSHLPAGGGTSTLQWQVLNATSLSIDHGVGAVTGTSKSVAVTTTTTFTLTATNNDGSSTTITTVAVGDNAPSNGGRYVAMVAPSSGELFIAPATLRLVAAAHDPNIYTNVPSPGLGG